MNNPNIHYIHPVVLDGQLYAFLVGNERTRVWRSADAVTWTVVTDALEVPDYHSKPVVFDGRICIVDTMGYFWTSTDAEKWNRSAAPVCRTLIITSSAILPIGKVSPSLFIEQSRLFLQPFAGTGQDSLLATEDLVNWDTVPSNVSHQVTDFTVVNNQLYLCGFNWSFPLAMWIGMRGTGGMLYLPVPVTSGSSDQYKFYMIDFFGTLLFGGQNAVSLSVYDFSCATPGWYDVKLPEEVRSCSFVSFHNDLYMLSNVGVYKAKR